MAVCCDVGERKRKCKNCKRKSKCPFRHKIEKSKGYCPAWLSCKE